MGEKDLLKKEPTGPGPLAPWAAELVPFAARERRLLPGTSLEVNDSSAADVAIVAAGVVDLYVDFRDTGSRRDYLFSIEAGGALMALPSSRVLRVTATGREGATLLEFELEAFRELIRGSGGRPRESLTAAGEAWLINLQSALERYAPAVDFVDERLRPGERLELEAGQRLVGSGGIVWVRFNNAEVSLLDGVEITAYGEPCCLPLSPKAWLTAGTDVTLEALSTAELLAERSWLRWVEYFNRMSLRLLRFHLAVAHREEQERLIRKASRVRRDRDAMLTRFSTLIDGVTEVDDFSGLTPLVAACRRIGEVLGTRVHPLPEGLPAGRNVKAQLEGIARRSRLRIRQVVLRGRWWREEMGPVLAFWRDSRTPIAVLPGRRGRLHYWDGVAGHGAATRPLTSEVAARVDPAAYSFNLTLPDHPLGAMDLLRFAFKVSRRDLLLVASSGVLGTVMAMAVPVATALLIDVTIPSTEFSQLVLIGLGLAVAALAVFSFKFCEDIAVLRVRGKMAGTLQPAVLDRLLRMPNTFFRRFSAGDLAERASTVDSLQERVTGNSTKTLLAGTFSLLNFVVMFYLDSGVALVAFAMVAVLFAGLVFLAPRQDRDWSEIQVLRGELSSMVLQMVTGIARIRLAGAEDRMFVRWGDVSMRSRELFLACYNTEVAFGAFATGYQVLSFAVIFGSVAFLGKTLTTGGFLAFVSAFTVTMTACVAMARTLLELVEVASMYRRVRPLLEAVPESEVDKVHPGALSGRIEVNDLEFRYGAGLPLVLQGLTFAVEAGEYVAIVGPSGCGKSTLLRLILGFEQPGAGSIYFDGKDLAGLDLRELRHQIGVVLQQDRLMDATIYENVRGDNDITVDEAWRAAHLCGIADDVEAMPLGMHTLISAQGSDLSGGQVQRLLIARALAARPRVLLLDEATSALDNQTQAVVTQSLERLRVTRLAIAHRLSTVKGADKILVIDQGRLVESGTYEELMEMDTFFANLVRRQLL